MPNGIVVFLLENHDLPVVRARALFKSSPLWVPGREGRAGRPDRRGHPQRRQRRARRRLARRPAGRHRGLDQHRRLDRPGERRLPLPGREHRRGPGAVRRGAARARVPRGQDRAVQGRPAAGHRQPQRRDDPDADPRLDRGGLRQGQPVRAQAGVRHRRGHRAGGLPDSCTRASSSPTAWCWPSTATSRTSEMKKLLAAKFGDWKRGDAAAVPPPPVRRRGEAAAGVRPEGGRHPGRRHHLRTWASAPTTPTTPR